MVLALILTACGGHEQDPSLVPNRSGERPATTRDVGWAPDLAAVELALQKLQDAGWPAGASRRVQVELDALREALVRVDEAHASRVPTPASELNALAAALRAQEQTLREMWAEEAEKAEDSMQTAREAVARTVRQLQEIVEREAQNIEAVAGVR